MENWSAIQADAPSPRESRNAILSKKFSRHLRPRLLENLDGAELTEALWAYVRRAQTGAGDAELVIGTAKNLEEATVRHVLKELTGEYPTSGRAASFPVVLYDTLPLSISPSLPINWKETLTRRYSRRSFCWPVRSIA